MLRHNSSSPKYDRIFNRISSGRSFIDVGLLAIADDLEHTSFLLQYERNSAAIFTRSYTGSKMLKYSRNIMH
jgi:hypothetical protein